MSGKGRPIVLVLLTIGIGITAFVVSRALKLRAQALARTPFTAFMVENQYSAGQSVPDHTEHYLRAIRSDTTEVTVWRRQSPNQEWMEPKLILDLPGARRVSVDVFTESLVTYPLSKDTVAYYQTWPKSECTGTTNPDHSSLLGFEVRKVHKSLPGPPGTQTSTDSFEAPALDCFALEEDWTLGSNEGPSRRITRQAMFVIQGEPEASLFKIPSRYTERSPSEVLAEFARRYPEHNLLPETDQRLDKVYQDAQATDR